MNRVTAEDAAKTIESLTKNLLECYEELDLIYRLARRLASTLDIQKNVELVLREAIEIFEADMGWVLPAGVGEGLFEAQTTGADQETVDLLQGRLVDGVISAGKSRMFDRLRDDPSLCRDGVPGAFLCTLLKTDETVFGVLCVGRRDHDGMFTAGDMKLANALASSAAISLENVRLNQRRIEEQQARIRLQEELRLAHDIQAQLLPTETPRLAGYDIAGSSLPAQGVGGDYYDFISMDGDRLAICLGDVAGKGMPAALLMSNLQASVRGQSLVGASPAACLNHSNTLLYQSTDDEKFATCFYGILDAREHRLLYSNAGHERPYMISTGGERSALDAGGLVLGVMPGVTYPEASVDLGPGELFLLYSDGITEAMNEREEEFGLERLLEVVTEHHDEESADVLQAILAAVDAHAGKAPVSDDRTIVVVRRAGNQVVAG